MPRRKASWIWLLRTPVPEPEGGDAYHAAFGAPQAGGKGPDYPHSISPNDTYLATQHEQDGHAYNLVSFPILGHRLFHIPELVERIVSAMRGLSAYDGVIITSKRAVQAWDEACEEAGHKISSNLYSPWQHTPFYVVGPATASSLASAALAAPFRPRTVLGAESGTGEVLATLLAQRLRKEPLGRRARFLYLVGDKRSPALRDTLQSQDAPIDLDELCVYETGKDTHFDAHCDQLARDVACERSMVQNDGEAAPDWIVFFSPSGGELALPVLTVLGWVRPKQMPRVSTPRIACIGPTTAAWVHHTLGHEPDAVAENPTPTSVHDAIVSAARP